MRSAPFADDNVKTPVIVNQGELVAADLRRQGRSPGKPHGPFLRLSDGDGWLFERKDNVTMMQEVQVTAGLWCYRVDNYPGGLALRKHPTHRQDLRYDPQCVFPHGMAVWADRRIEAQGTTFVRVQGTAGWLFTSRDGTQTLTPWHPAEVPPVEDSSSTNLDLRDVRVMARMCRLQETMFNEISRVISFSSQLGEETARINVYYTTGTVGTCLEHPRLGKTQLFRRGCTMEALATIMANPRVHTGKGYYKRKNAETNAPQTFCENTALRRELQGLEEELESLVKKRRGLLQFLESKDASRAAQAQAAVEAQKTQDAQTAAIRKRQREAEEKDIERKNQAVQKEISHRGKMMTYLLAEHLSSVLDEQDKSRLNSACCIALGDGYFFLWGDGDCMYRDIPRQLHNKINGRQKSLPKPEYVAMGSPDRYYVRFADGSSQWSAPPEFTSAINGTGKNVAKVAFGESGGYYNSAYWFILFSDGSCQWDPDLPDNLASLIRTCSSAIRDVTLGPSGEWFIIWENMKWDSSRSNYDYTCIEDNLQQQGRRVRLLLFGNDSQVLVRYS